jgi:hypothetical protein
MLFLQYCFPFCCFASWRYFLPSLDPLSLHKLEYYSTRVFKIPDDMYMLGTSIHSRDKTGYFRTSSYKVPDPELGFRGRSMPRLRDPRVGENNYVRYGLKAPSGVIEWTTNQGGFRGNASDEASNIVVIGASFINHGWTEEDSFWQETSTPFGAGKLQA